MIIVRYRGGLGNQMFQYATVRWYQVKYAKEEPISLNFGLVYKEGKKEKRKERERRRE